MPSLSRVFEADWLLVQTRKGTVGARLPYEPWNIDLKELDPMQIPRPLVTARALGGQLCSKRTNKVFTALLQGVSEIKVKVCNHERWIGLAMMQDIFNNG